MKRLLIIILIILLIISALVVAIFFMLEYAKETDAYLSYREFEVTGNWVSHLIDEDLAPNHGKHHESLFSYDSYYTFGSGKVSPEQAVIVKKVRGSEESYALLYQPEAVENPYALLAPTSATLFFGATKNESSDVTVTIGDAREISAFWSSFLELAPIALDSIVAKEPLSLNGDTSQNVMLQINGMKFTLCVVGSERFWCIHNWNDTKCFLVPYDADLFDRYLSLYSNLPLEAIGGEAA